MKLFVNKEACIGCGACVAIDSAHFDFDENGYSEVVNNENVDTEEARNAISSCPTSAISYIDDNENHEEEHNCENCDHKCCEHDEEN